MSAVAQAAIARVRLGRRTLWLALLTGSLVASCVLGITQGSATVSWMDVLQGRDDAATHVLSAIRVPRVILGAVAGSALAMSGAVLQGLFRNPLVDPTLLGISQGAGLGAASVFVLGAKVPALATLGHWLLPVVAFFGALVAASVTWRIGSVAGRTGLLALLLAGIGVGAVASAGIGALTVIATDSQHRDITFWFLGSLNGASWPRLGAALPFALTAIAFLPRTAAALNAISLGEAVAGHLGVRVQRIKLQLIVLTSLAVGATIALTGVIGFVGLVAPHVVRLCCGPDHRLLVPASGLTGGALLVLADVLARTLIAPAEIPIGILLSLVGAPFFLLLVMRLARREVLP